MKLPDVGRKIRVLAIDPNDRDVKVRVGEEVTVKYVYEDDGQIYLETHDDGLLHRVGARIIDWEYVEEPDAKADESYVYAPGQRTAEAKCIELGGTSPVMARLFWGRLDDDERAKWARIEAAAQEPVKVKRVAAIARAKKAESELVNKLWLAHSELRQVLTERDERDDRIARLEKALREADDVRSRDDDYGWRAYDKARAALDVTKQDSGETSREPAKSDSGTLGKAAGWNPSASVGSTPARDGSSVSNSLPSPAVSVFAACGSAPELSAGEGRGFKRIDDLW